MNEKYKISRNRYRELKYFCLQYNEWQKAYLKNPPVRNSEKQADITGEYAVYLAGLKTKMDTVTNCCMAADPFLSMYLFKGVTMGIPYGKIDIPFNELSYEEAYERFFWLLDKCRYA